MSKRRQILLGSFSFSVYMCLCVFPLWHVTSCQVITFTCKMGHVARTVNTRERRKRKSDALLLFFFFLRLPGAATVADAVMSVAPFPAALQQTSKATVFSALHRTKNLLPQHFFFFSIMFYNVSRGLKCAYESEPPASYTPLLSSLTVSSPFCHSPCFSFFFLVVV